MVAIACGKDNVKIRRVPMPFESFHPVTKIIIKDLFSYKFPSGYLILVHKEIITCLILLVRRITCKVYHVAVLFRNLEDSCLTSVGNHHQWKTFSQGEIQIVNARWQAYSTRQ